MVVFLAILLSIGSFIYYYSHGLTLTPSDSKAHLNIARRVIFSLNPGLTQLGGVWLPLPHLLMLPTIWNNFMYYSGLSGSIISMVSYVVAVTIIFKAVYSYTKSLTSSFLSASIMALNPALLYLQTTPMTELLSIALSVIPIYLLMKWTKSNNFILLIIAAFFVTLSTLSRYDNLFLIPASALTIIVVLLLKHFKRKTIEGKVLLFLTLASFGFFLWLLYNQIIFGNALNFAFTEGSASWHATAQSTLSKHDLWITILTFSWVSIDNIGIITGVLMLLGIVVFIYKYKLKPESIPAYLFLVPVVFNVVSLYLGQSIVRTEHLPPFSLYNTRYGMVVIPAAAFFIGTLYHFSRKSFFIFIPIIIFQYYLLLFTSPVIFLQESLQLKNKDAMASMAASKEASKWTKQHPTGGLTLFSTLSSDSFTFDAQIPQRKIIYEGSGKLWGDSLKEPEKYVTRIIMGSILYPQSVPDEVWKALYGSDVLQNNYHIVYDIGFMKIYDRNQDNTPPLALNLHTPDAGDTENVAISSPATSSTTYHTVTEGECLWTIAGSYYGRGIEWTQIKTPDGLKIIRPGEIIELPPQTQNTI